MPGQQVPRLASAPDFPMPAPPMLEDRVSALRAVVADRSEIFAQAVMLAVVPIVNVVGMARPGTDGSLGGVLRES
jgi:hypothetical protein